MSSPLIVERRGKVLEVTINRPKANAIDAPTSRIMGETFAKFRDDPDLRVAILTGSGEKFFCPGWDLKAAAEGWHAWMSGIRRDQSPDRAKAPIIGWDKKFNLVKISPLANWSKKDVWKLITDEDVPYNPLHDQGYPSIGCWPCTRSVMFGEDERAGRWSGFKKTECGLHTSE